MIRGARYAYIGLAWAFIAGVVVQVFLIGQALFVSSENFATHRDVGYIVQLVPVLVLVAAAVARAGRTRILHAAALTAVVIAFPLLPPLRDSAPVIAALHPVGALVAFWLGIMVVRDATANLREADARGAPSGEQSANG